MHYSLFISPIHKPFSTSKKQFTKSLQFKPTKITCIIVTTNMGWALQVAHKLGIKGVLPSAAYATSLRKEIKTTKEIQILFVHIGQIKTHIMMTKKT